MKKNAQNKNISYDLMVTRECTPRHQEPFSHHDFWVTRYKSGEVAYTQLPSYVIPPESIDNTDVVVWYISPAHHMPRSEDGRFRPNWSGVALVMWSGFDLRPRDLFDQTPFFP